MIADAIKSQGPPPSPRGGSPEGREPTRGEWASMNTRQQEDYVADLVERALEGIARDDEHASLLQENKTLKEQLAKMSAGGRKPAPRVGEDAPDISSKVKKWLWGAEPDPVRK